MMVIYPGSSCSKQAVAGNTQEQNSTSISIVHADIT